MSEVTNVVYEPVEGASEIFTPEFLEYLVAAHKMFTPTIHKLRSKRTEILNNALKNGVMPDHLSESIINTGDWKVPIVPDELRNPGIEISGPASLTSMFINALNPGPDGTRAEGYLDDDEDSGGHRLIDTVTAAINRKRSVEGSLSYQDIRRGKTYKIEEGPLPFFMHRDRAIHLDETDVRIKGDPVPAAILGTALTLFHAGRSQIERGQGVYFYIPKLESAQEAAFYRDFFDFSKTHLRFPADAVVRAIILVESLPAVYQMEEMLHALGPYGAGLNAARWDLKASILEYIMMDPKLVWPDRFGVDIKTTDFLANIFRRLVAICLKRNAVPIGGMATALPDKNPEVNETAGATIESDKEWEAKQGFLRAWVAHIFHMKAAAEPFKNLRDMGWEPTSQMSDPNNYPVSLTVPNGPITIEGTRRNIRTIIEYVEGWMMGRGAKGIDSLEGKPGVHPRLMEDLATARISVAQTAQRILHRAKDSNTGEVHNFKLVKRLADEELDDILKRRENDSQFDMYRKSKKFALRWTKNYTDLNFRSLGSYTRTELNEISLERDAF